MTTLPPSKRTAKAEANANQADAQPTHAPKGDAQRKIRHILGLSGGKDSAALAVLMYNRVPEMEYFFCDTGKELGETYEFLDRLKARLGIKIHYLQEQRGFDHWLTVYGGLLPSAKMRWCTKKLKIEPLEEFVGDDEAISYVGLRADEARDGYISTKPNIRAVFPFREEGIDRAGVIKLLEDAGIGMPDYYRWRSRSGCFFCFYQKKIEWVRLADEHPKLFAEAIAYEETHTDGRKYTWTHGETLRELIARRAEIEAEHAARESRKRSLPVANAPLAAILSAQLDDDEAAGCVVCHI